MPSHTVSIARTSTPSSFALRAPADRCPSGKLTTPPLPDSKERTRSHPVSRPGGRWTESPRPGWNRPCQSSRNEKEGSPLAGRPAWLRGASLGHGNTNGTPPTVSAPSSTVRIRNWGKSKPEIPRPVRDDRCLRVVSTNCWTAPSTMPQGRIRFKSPLNPSGFEPGKPVPAAIPAARVHLVADQGTRIAGKIVRHVQAVL